MPTTKEMKQRFHQNQKKLIISLIFNLMVPWVLYALILRPLFNNDAAPLAISTSIPVIRTLILLALRRKIDWIGVIGAFSFSIAIVASIYYGGSSLPLKIIHPIILGILGLIFLVSVLLKRPLLLIIVKRLRPDRLGNPIAHKKLTVMSVMFGGILLIGSITHIIMALTLSTSVYLATSHIVTWITIIALMVSGKVIAPRIK
jgi:hypothetical protein